AKGNILKYQSINDVAILNRDDPGSFNLRGMVKGNLISFGISQLSRHEEGTFLQNDSIWMRQNGQLIEICSLKDIPLRGEHNVYNVLAACAISSVLGFKPALIKDAILAFKGVPHRLQFVREWNGIQWFDDSIA